MQRAVEVCVSTHPAVRDQTYRGSPLIFAQVVGSSIIGCEGQRIDQSSARTFAVALYLSIERGRPINRAAAQTVLFGDQAAANAAHSIRQYVYRLRQMGFPIEARRHDLLLPADAVAIDLDVALTSRSLSRDQVQSIRRGVLPEFAVTGLPLFADWLDAYRARAERDLQRAVLRDLACARDAGDWTEAEQLARTCLALDPLNEVATLGLAEALALSGSKAAAIKTLDAYASEVALAGADLRIPANVLRRRIAERLPERPRASRGELPFVGRQDEMRLLVNGLRRVRTGDGQCVLVHGEPGIGKTRLASEFSNVAILEGARIARVAVQPHDAHRPLAAFEDLVPSLLQMPGALGCSPASMQALRQLTGREVASDTTAFEALDSDTRYHRTTTAIHDLIEAIAAECPLLIVVEDAHWADPFSLQFIGSLAAHRGNRRLMLVLTSRERNALIEHARFADRIATLHLEPLNADVSRELAGFALAASGVPGDGELVQRVQETAGGNPLFVGSLAEHWRDPAAQFSMPGSVTSLINYQLERVSATGLTVLHTVILLGRHCTVARIAECLEIGPLQLADALQELEDRSLLVRDASVTECRHWLISEAALNAAPPTKMKWLHTCVAGYLEREGRRGGERAMLWNAAEHWIKAGEGENAYADLLECAAAAASIGRSREASDILARAAELTSDHDRKVSALEQALRQAAASCEPLCTFELFSALRRLGTPIPPDLALLEIDALSLIGTPTDTVVARIEELIEQSGSDEITTEAALQLMKIADRVSDASLARRALDIRSRVKDMPRSSWLSFDMSYETMYGSPDRGLAVARELLSTSGSWPSASRLEIRYTIAQTFLVAGRTGDALRMHAEIYETGLAVGSRAVPMGSACVCAGVSRDLENADDFEMWAARVRQVAADDASLSCPFLALFEADCSLWRGDVEDTLARAGALQRLALRTGATHLWKNATGLGIAAKHMRGERAAAELAQLDLDISRLRGVRADDLLLQVACEELELAGREADARELLRTYMDQLRLVRFPVWFGLTRLAKRLGATPAMAWVGSGGLP